MHFIRKLSFTTIIGTVFGIFLGTYGVLAFASPSAIPPGANVLPFINVGPDYQEKIGDLWANTLGLDGGLVTSGYLQLGQPAGPPVAADCDESGEAGRTKYDTDSKILYTCKGASGWGSITGLLLDIIPPVISSISASNITQTSASITWSTDELSDSQVEFCTSSTPCGFNTSLKPTPLTSHTVNLSGLISSTTYYYWVKSTDSEGNLATSSMNTFTTVAPPPPDPVDPTNLVAHWMFDGNTSDETGRGHDATNIGADLTTDRNSQSNMAYDFVRANNDRMTVPDSSDFAFGSGDYSISAWIRTNELSNNQQHIYYQDTTAGVTYLRLMVHDTGRLSWNVKIGNVSRRFAQTAQNTILANTWYHVAFVADRDTGSYMYINGVSVPLATNEGPIETNSIDFTNIVHLGDGLGGSPWNGKIDDLRIYKRALSSAEATALYTATPPPDPVDPTGLVGYWKFDGDATDASPNNNDGTVFGATLTTGMDGLSNRAYDFDGNNDYIDLGSGGGVANTFTIGAWFNSSSIGTTQRIVNWRPSSGDANEIRFMLSGSKLNALIIDSSGSGGNTYKDYKGATTLQNGTWYYYAITWDGANLELYLNGVKDTSYTKTTDGSVTMTDTPRNRNIGRATAGVAYFNGKLDNIRIYQRALSPAEITALYTVTPPPPDPVDPTNLVAHWKFDGNASDATGRGHNATNVGANLTTDKDGQGNKAYNFVPNDYMSVPDSSDFAFGSGDYSISAWVRSNELANIQRHIYFQETTSGVTYLRLMVHDTGRVSWNVKMGNVSQRWAQTNQNTILANTWYNVVFVADRSVGSYIYVNGVSQPLATNEGPTETSSIDFTSSVYLGVWKTTTGPWNGKLDDIRVYKRVLSPAEVTALYNAGV